MGMMIHRWKVAKAAEKAASVVSNTNTNTKETVENVETVNETKEEKTNKKYTKTEINRMALLELQALAKEIGIEDASEKSGAELKKILIAHFGL